MFVVIFYLDLLPVQKVTWRENLTDEKAETTGGRCRNSEPIPCEYSCQVTSGVNKAMLSHRKQWKCTDFK